VIHIGENDVIIDLEDYDRTKHEKWIMSSGRPIRYWYENYKCYSEPLCKSIIAVEKGLTVDYINGNKLDLRKENLRVCTRKERTRHHNLYKNNTTGKSGVCRNTETKYIISISIEDENGNSDRILLPCDDYKLAVDIRLAFEVIFYKEFAPFR
jgi:hypothetical protein